MSERFEAVCEGCGLNKIVEWDGEKGLCDSCRTMSDHMWYHIVDCGDGNCALCPTIFRGSEEDDAIQTARSHDEDIGGDVDFWTIQENNDE